MKFPKDVTALSRAKIDEVIAEARGEYQELRKEEPTPENVEKLKKLVEGIEGLQAELTARDTQEQELADLDSRMETEDPEPSEDPQEDPEEKPKEDPEPEPEPAEDPEEEPAKAEVEDPEPAEDPEVEEVEKQPVAASASERIKAVARRQPEISKPKPPAQQPLTVVAAGDVPGYSVGSEIPDLYDVGKAFAGKVSATRGKGGSYPVASFQVEYPEERRLNGDGSVDDIRKIEDVISPKALVAAGGLCAPVAVSYDLANISQAARPVRDGLAMFQASRGGIQFVSPPVLADVSGAVSIWSEATDETPGAETKDCLTIVCGETTTVNVDAVPLCLEVGNFSRQFFPEQFETFFALALAQHARVAEGNLLDSIGAASTAVTDGQNLGAARDLLEAWGRGSAQYRNRHRMSPTATIQLFTPAWVRDMIRADLAREAPGSADERLAVADATIANFLSTRNLAPTYYEDTETGEGQVFGTQNAGAMDPWITDVVSYLFHPGAFLFLEGGTLDLGTEIRDSSLNETNDVRAFLETFEEAAFVGVESIKLTNTVCVSGEAAALEDFTCPGTGS